MLSRNTFRALAVVTSLSLSGCASVQLDTARSAWLAGDSERAIEALSDDDIPSRDRLLAKMEKGLIQHESGDYAGSILTLLSAVDLLESRDFLSVSELSGSLIVSEWATTYKGEYAERLWLHTYLIMNFLLLEQHESAAVEARRALKIIEQHDSVLHNDIFSRLLTAVAFDAAGQSNDAYVAYRNLARLLPDASAIASPLTRVATLLGQFEEAEKYRKLTHEVSESVGAGGELIVFVASGNIPHKRPGDLFVFPDVRLSFPFYPPHRSPLPQLTAKQGSQRASVTVLGTQLDQVIAESLDARGAQLAAKQAARVAVKSAIAESASSEAATEILKAVFFVLEEADTRSWQTLPAGLTLVRVPLPAGEQTVTLSAHSGALDWSDRDQTTFSVTIEPGQTVFRRWRLPVF